MNQAPRLRDRRCPSAGFAPRTFSHQHYWKKYGRQQLRAYWHIQLHLHLEHRVTEPLTSAEGTSRYATDMRSAAQLQTYERGGVYLNPTRVSGSRRRQRRVRPPSAQAATPPAAEDLNAV
jgi:hypothetical protein